MGVLRHGTTRGPRAARVGAIAALVALAGCGAGASPPAADPGFREAASAGSPGMNVKLPKRVDNRVAARRHVRLTSCADGRAAGRATGPQASYRLTVYFTTARATVVGFGRTTVRVPASGRAEWAVSSASTTRPDGLRCVLVGVA